MRQPTQATQYNDQNNDLQMLIYLLAIFGLFFNIIYIFANQLALKCMKGVIFVFCTLKEESTCAEKRPQVSALSPLPSVSRACKRLLFQSASGSPLPTTFLNKYGRETLKAYFRPFLPGLIGLSRLHRPVNGSFCQHPAQTRNLIVLLMCYFLEESPLRNAACWLTLEEYLGSGRLQTGQAFT